MGITTDPTEYTQGFFFLFLAAFHRTAPSRSRERKRFDEEQGRAFGSPPELD